MADSPPHRHHLTDPGQVGMPESDAACITPTDVDVALIVEARNGRNEAFAELFRRHWSPVLGYAINNCTSCRATAEDLVAHAFAATFDLLRRGLGPHSGMRWYLVTAVRNAMCNRQAREDRLTHFDNLQHFEGVLPRIDDPAAAFVEFASPAPEHERIAVAFRNLPPRWQYTLKLTVIDELPPREVTWLLGLNNTAVAALAYRARRRLRDHYDALTEADDQQAAA